MPRGAGKLLAVRELLLLLLRSRREYSGGVPAARGELFVRRPPTPLPGEFTLELFDLPTGRLLKSRSYRDEETTRAWSEFPFTNGGVTVIDPTHEPALSMSDPRLEKEPNLLYPLGHGQSLHCEPDLFSRGGPLATFLDAWPWARDWCSGDGLEIGVWDCERRHFLWGMALKSIYHGRIRLTSDGNYALFDRTSALGRELAVLELPICATSPWWSRSAGLLIAALVLFTGRRRPAY